MVKRKRLTITDHSRATGTRSLELFWGQASAFLSAGSLHGHLRIFLACLLAIGGLPALPPSAEAASPYGYHDISDCTQTKGWTCDPDDFATPVSVYIYKDGPKGTGVAINFPVANDPEAAVGTRCGGTVNHGFASTTPTSLKDGQAHSIYTYAVDAGTSTFVLLSGSPKTLTCAPPPNNAVFVSQSVPTSLAPGETRAVSVTMKNTGTATWTSSAGYRLGSQNPQDNTTWGLGRVLLSSSVIPGASKTFSFTIKAPATVGHYNFRWRMLREGVEWFGALSTNVRIHVTAPKPATPPMLAPTSGTVFPTTTTAVTLDWGGVTGAVRYAVRASDDTDSTYNTDPAKRYAGNTCTAHYLCKEDVSSTSTILSNVPVQARHSYTWWVRAVNSFGVWSNAVYTNFSVDRKRYKTAGGFRIRTDSASECAAANPLTNGCSCPSGFSAKPLGVGRGTGVVPSRDNQAIFDIASGVLTAPQTLALEPLPPALTAATIPGTEILVIPPVIADAIPYLMAAVAIVRIALAIYALTAGEPAPGSPGLVYTCVQDSPAILVDGYQGGYSFRQDGGGGSQRNEVATGDFTCPPGAVTDDVAHTLSASENRQFVVACRDPDAPLTETTRSSYGGMFQMGEDKCIQGNAIGDLSVTTSYTVVEGLVQHPFNNTIHAFLFPRRVSLLDFQESDDWLSPATLSCSCRAGYAPLPIANLSTWGGKGSSLSLCQSTAGLPFTFPNPTSTTGLLRGRTFNWTTQQGLGTWVVAGSGSNTPRYISTKVTRAVDNHAFFFSRLRPDSYLLFPIIPSGYRDVLYSICRNSTDASCPTLNSFQPARDWGLEQGLPDWVGKVRYVPVRVYENQYVDVYLAFIPQ